MRRKNGGKKREVERIEREGKRENIGKKREVIRENEKIGKGIERIDINGI